MKLIRFRVQNFRSVIDSGWIDTDNVTALIGTNESGKTNLLVPLWKLKPAKDGEINPMADYPRKQYGDIRAMEKKPVFITAEFELSDELASKIAALSGATVRDVRIAQVTRDLGGNYTVGFPHASPLRSVPRDQVTGLLVDAANQIGDLDVGKSEQDLRDQMLQAITAARGHLDGTAGPVDIGALEAVQESLDTISTEGALKRSLIGPRFEGLREEVSELVGLISKPTPSSNPEARKLVRQSMPSFVYYSNYGNLDSEIYLPHVIQNLERTDLGGREEAKARTLRVLFDFVKLSAKEILELGRDFNQKDRQPTAEELQKITSDKKEREILLQAASSSLTEKFRNWWKQGDYRFRFQADGNHFRIWVSDDKRTEEIELEGRSTGLQWFLSFYLVFLVESAEGHRNAILLLDEPGLSLHPMAQKDLSAFFESLSGTNQLLYTTHSPFLVDSDHLDRVKAVFVDDEGTTKVSPNLRAGAGPAAQARSIYPVHAALGLSVSDTLLLGCQPVVVEGVSDQIVLNTIKNWLIGKALISPTREMVFVPSGGVKGISAVTAILTGTDEELPYVVLDSDTPGEDLRKKLVSGPYKSAPDRLLMLEAISGIPGAEIEDLLPTELVARLIDKIARGRDEDFSDVVDGSKPIVPQVEQFARENGVVLDLGWKVELAKQVKTKLLKPKNPVKDVEAAEARWKVLFDKLTA